MQKVPQQEIQRVGMTQKLKFHDRFWTFLQIQQQSLHHLEHIHQLTQHPLVISRVDQSK